MRGPGSAGNLSNSSLKVPESSSGSSPGNPANVDRVNDRSRGRGLSGGRKSSPRPASKDLIRDSQGRAVRKIASSVLKAKCPSGRKDFDSLTSGKASSSASSVRLTSRMLLNARRLAPRSSKGWATAVLGDNSPVCSNAPNDRISRRASRDSEVSKGHEDRNDRAAIPGVNRPVLIRARSADALTRRLLSDRLEVASVTGREVGKRRISAVADPMGVSLNSRALKAALRSAAVAQRHANQGVAGMTNEALAEVGIGMRSSRIFVLTQLITEAARQDASVPPARRLVLFLPRYRAARQAAVRGQ